jgi:4-carboxymuconolactone decarboxylase
MARIAYVDPASASAGVVETLAKVPDLNVFRLVANSPAAVSPMLRYGGTLLSRLDLDPILRELAILRVAAVTNCDYERIQHEAIAIAVGASAEQVALAVTRGEEGAETEGLVLRFAEAASAGDRVDPAITDELIERLGTTSLVELLLVVGHYRGLAVLMNTLEIDPDEPAGERVLASARARSHGPS